MFSNSRLFWNRAKITFDIKNNPSHNILKYFCIISNIIQAAIPLHNMFTMCTECTWCIVVSRNKCNTIKILQSQAMKCLFEALFFPQASWMEKTRPGENFYEQWVLLKTPYIINNDSALPRSFCCGPNNKKTMWINLNACVLYIGKICSAEHPNRIPRYMHF